MPCIPSKQRPCYIHLCIFISLQEAGYMVVVQLNQVLLNEIQAYTTYKVGDKLLFYKGNLLTITGASYAFQGLFVYSFRDYQRNEDSS